MRRALPAVLLAVLLVGCQYAPLPLDSSLWPRVDIGGYEYVATSSDPANKPYFDTLQVFRIGDFPTYTPALVGSYTISPGPGLYNEQSITIDPALSGTTLTVRKWNAEPMNAYASGDPGYPSFQFPTANAAYLFDVSNPAAPSYLGMSFF
jgi:hypothetical protein